MYPSVEPGNPVVERLVAVSVAVVVVVAVLVEAVTEEFKLFRGTQREYGSKPLKHSIVKRILVFKP